VSADQTRCSSLASCARKMARTRADKCRMFVRIAGQDIPHAESCERCAAMIKEKWVIKPCTIVAFGDKRT
jgi:hypothetical protein